MDDAEYTKEVVGGDIHTKNQKAAGLPTRNDAKTFIYALLYGAGDGKIGKIIGKGVKEGRKLKENFFEAIPKLRKLFLDIGQQAKYHGFVTGLDGRKIWTRSEHAALNTLLQGGGAIVCKLWTVYIHKFANEQGLRFQQLVSVHDEYQFQVHKDDVEAFGAVTKAAMKEVEKVLKMKCPLDSTWKKGYNWSETH
jgi:DNA polymerase-1